MKEISNIKISCVFLLPLNWRDLLIKITNKRNISSKKNANIIIIKDKYVLCIFEKKDKTVHFNVTKIISIPDIFNFLFFFSREYFSYECVLLSLKIDNITASFNLKKKINFGNIALYNLNHTFNSERFAGLFIKLSKGTVIVFRNGKINIVGCKTVNDVKEIWCFVEPILRKCAIIP
jgi:Transcription factor TFIID (or TATA-binding protein, TBP)